MGNTPFVSHFGEDTCISKSKVSSAIFIFRDAYLVFHKIDKTKYCFLAETIYIIEACCIRT